MFFRIFLDLNRSGRVRIGPFFWQEHDPERDSHVSLRLRTGVHAKVWRQTSAGDEKMDLSRCRGVQWALIGEGSSDKPSWVGVPVQGEGGNGAVFKTHHSIGEVGPTKSQRRTPVLRYAPYMSKGLLR